jgi:hypothetical protein
MNLFLQVRLCADAPTERIMMIGSHEALGRWNPSRGAALEWNGDMWVTKIPIALPLHGRVEFKFVRLQPSGEAEWETGSNRIIEAPANSIDLHFQGRFNGESMVHLGRPGTSHMGQLNGEDTGSSWKLWHDEVVQEFEVQRREAQAMRQAHNLKQRHHIDVLDNLKQELSETRRKVSDIVAATSQEYRTAAQSLVEASLMQPSVFSPWVLPSSASNESAATSSTSTVAVEATTATVQSRSREQIDTGGYGGGTSSNTQDAGEDLAEAGVEEEEHNAPIPLKAST